MWQRTLENLKFVNFGGGFGIPYRPDQAAIDFEKLAAIVEPHLSEFISNRDNEFAFLIEPGRYLVAEAGALLVEVTNVKTVGDHVFVGTDSGMNHLIRPAMYGAYHEVVNVSNSGGAKRIYTVVGNICESSDFFAQDRSVSEVRIGDTLAIMDVGAYGISMASHYNLRQLPSEVLIRRNDESLVVITQRVSNDDAVEAILGMSKEMEISLKPQ